MCANAIAFFSGAGGLDMGLVNANFDLRLSLEIEETFCQTLRSNHPTMNVYRGDILTLDAMNVRELANLEINEEIDLIAGGSPCQSFSTAGKRQAFDDVRGQAMIRYAELVRDLRPRAFLLENVKGLLSAALKHRPLNERGSDFPPLSAEEQPGSALNYLLSFFDEYNVTYQVLNAADYGVPQKRERVFIIGIRRDLNSLFEFPSPTHAENGIGGLERWVTFGDISRTLEHVEHEYSNYSAARLKWMKMIPKGGGNWRDLKRFGEDVVKEAMKGAYSSGGGKVGYFRRISLNAPAPTLLTTPAQNSTNLGHPLEDRPLSIQEYLAIQQFPNDYFLAGTLTKKYTQVGNAVPVGLATILASKIYDIVE